MKFFVLSLILLLPCMASAVEVPKLQGRVNDYAGLISAQAVQEADRRLAELERSDSTQVVVLTVPSLEGESIEGFSIRVAESWRIGQKGLDNGAILIIAKQERKIRIEVGRGLEGKLTDLQSGRIIRDEIAPRLRQGDLDGGVIAGIAAISATVKGEYQAKTRPREGVRHTSKQFHPSFTLLIFLFVAIVFLGSIARFLGGLTGAVGLPLLGFLGFPGLGLAFLAGLAVAGFLLGLFITFLFGSGGGMGWGGPFGGGYGGGSWGGGSDGGFSGGGGDFGGGGASGDW